MDKCCSKCGEIKPLNEFSRQLVRPDGHRAQCKMCDSACGAEYRQRGVRDVGPVTLTCKHCERSFTYIKTTGRRRFYCTDRCRQNASQVQKLTRATSYVRKCACGSTEVAKVGKPVCRTCQKDKRDPLKAKAKERRRSLRLYGLTPETFDGLLAAQGGECAICRTTEPSWRDQWHIDHDHACCPGKGSCGSCVRGLLCQNCNLLLGHAVDSTERLDLAKTYLLKHSQWSLQVKESA